MSWKRSASCKMTVQAYASVSGSAEIESRESCVRAESVSRSAGARWVPGTGERCAACAKRFSAPHVFLRVKHPPNAYPSLCDIDPPVRNRVLAVPMPDWAGQHRIRTLQRSLPLGFPLLPAAGVLFLGCRRRCGPIGCRCCGLGVRLEPLVFAPT